MHTILKHSFLALLLFFGTFSCKKVDEVTSVRFNLDFNENTTLPAIPIVLTSPVSYDYPFSTDRPDDYAAHQTAKSLVQEVVLKEASIHITAPEDANFQFLELVRFYINADGLEKKVIAQKEVVPEDIGKDLYLDIIDQDLSAYLKKDEIVLTVEVDTDAVTTEELELNILTLFGVKAGLL